MHELSIAESIVSSLEKFREQEGFKILRGVKIEIGPLAGVDLQALRFAMDSIKDDTILADTEVELIPIGMKVECSKCGKVTEVKDYEFICRKCGSRKIEMVSGDSLEITELEVD